MIDVLICAYARTAMGGFRGVFSNVSAVLLGQTAIGAAVERAGVRGSDVDRVYMGCVLPAALGQAPARQAALGAGLPVSVAATTINKMCGSGMETAILGYQVLRSGSARVVVAGGMESMTNAPYALTRHRSGARIGHDQVIDTMLKDGLEDAYDVGRPMGAFAEEVAVSYQFTRAEQDAYALESLERALAAVRTDAFDAELTPVQVEGGRNTVRVERDEQPGKVVAAKIPSLRPAFAKDGTITAASSASISDGGAAIVLATEEACEALGLAKVARIVGVSVHATEPRLFATAPVGAIRKLLEAAGWHVDDVDLFEINEAFAIVPMVAMRELNIPRDRMNVNGGATALGHPIGSSGARIIATLASALSMRSLKRGVAAVCIGGGEATAIAIELV